MYKLLVLSLLRFLILIVSEFQKVRHVKAQNQKPYTAKFNK